MGTLFLSTPTSAMHRFTVFLAVSSACDSNQKSLLQEYCLNNLKPKWSLSNITILQCTTTPLGVAPSVAHHFKYLRHGPRDHCTCIVLVKENGAISYDSYC